MNQTLGRIAYVGTLVVVTACGSGSQERAAESDQAVPAPADTAGMGGMPGMGMESGKMMASMMSHMNMMQGVSADSMKAMMPMHRQMAANMLPEMNREMRTMNMTADAAWSATVDSVRTDLTRMPEMSAAELQALMPGHHRRMQRLMEAHQAMMKNMRM